MFTEQDEREIKMFDCTIPTMEKILDECINSGKDVDLMIMSMLTDVQEMLKLGIDRETARRTLNRAKYFLLSSKRIGGTNDSVR